MPLVADLESFELCDVRAGQELDRLAFLGPSETSELSYPGKGLLVDFENGRLGGFVLALRRGAALCSARGGEVHPFAGHLRFAGSDRAPQELRGESDFTSAWGEPYWRDEDDEEVLLFFEFPAHEIQVEFNLNGVPQVLTACAPPLMSDPEQRRLYGVSKSWPPVYIEDAP